MRFEREASNTFTLAARPTLSPSEWLLRFVKVDSGVEVLCVADAYAVAGRPVRLTFVETDTTPTALDGEVTLSPGQWQLYVYEQASATNLNYTLTDRLVYDTLVEVVGAAIPDPEPTDPCEGEIAGVLECDDLLDAVFVSGGGNNAWNGLYQVGNDTGIVWDNFDHVVGKIYRFGDFVIYEHIYTGGTNWRHIDGSNGDEIATSDGVAAPNPIGDPWDDTWFVWNGGGAETSWTYTQGTVANVCPCVTGDDVTIRTTDGLTTIDTAAPGDNYDLPQSQVKYQDGANTLRLDPSDTEYSALDGTVNPAQVIPQRSILNSLGNPASTFPVRLVDLTNNTVPAAADAALTWAGTDLDTIPSNGTLDIDCDTLVDAVRVTAASEPTEITVYLRVGEINGRGYYEEPAFGFGFQYNGTEWAAGLDSNYSAAPGTEQYPWDADWSATPVTVVQATIGTYCAPPCADVQILDQDSNVLAEVQAGDTYSVIVVSGIDGGASNTTYTNSIIQA